MKRIVCTICQGHDFRMINENEYMCQGCGIVYTAAQVRSLLREVGDAAPQAPAAAPAPEPIPAPIPVPEPIPEPIPVPEPVPEPIPEPIPVPEPIPEPEPVPEPIPEPEPVPEPIPVPVTFRPEPKAAPKVEEPPVQEKSYEPEELPVPPAEPAESDEEILSRPRVKNTCPKCGSKNITIDGVAVNAKKGLGYYLSGQAAYVAGMRHGEKLRKILSGAKSNGVCHSCGFEWNE